MVEIRFDADIASRYDESTAPMSNPAVLDPTVAFLAELAGDGAALEFAIGTGRVAIPLSARGVHVRGIDISPFMLERMGEKPGVETIPVTVGDMATTRIEGSYRLVYLVFNTIMNLTSQDEQVACFENAAAHLEPGGSFVVEVAVPDLRRLPPGERLVAFAVEPGYAGVDEYTDVTRQMMSSHHYTVHRNRSDLVSMPFRYVWPSELDLMARIAGLRLAERWSGWDRRPFTGESRSHVSVWCK
jgi:hypothetical protein